MLLSRDFARFRAIARSSLLGSTLPVAMLVSPMAQAQAVAEPVDQSAASEAEADKGGAIVVTGIRASLNSALNVKRQAATVVDAISSEDIGHYPDVNIAESVQRISGVQINRARGEGQSVNIRGLPATFTLATLNGRSVANALSNADATASRAFDFTILAPEFVRSLEVYKAPTADLEEGGLSGTVNIRTPRALEIGKRILAGSIQGEFEGNSGKTSPRASLLFSDTFADDRLGVTLGLSYSKRRPETHSMTQSYAFQTEGSGVTSGSGAADLDGNGVIEPSKGVRLPGTLFYYIFQEERERYAATSSVEFKPTDSLKLYVEGLYSRLDVKAVRNESIAYVNNSRGLVDSTSEVLEGHPTVTGIQLSRLDQRGNGRFEDRSGDLYTISGGGKWEKDGWTLQLEGTYSRSQQERNHLTIATSAVGEGAFSTAVGEDLPSVDFLGSFAQGWQNPANYIVASINGEFLRKSTDRLWDTRFNAIREFGDRGITRLAIGARYADRAQYQSNGRLTITPAAVSRLYGGLPAGVTAGSFSAAPFMQLVKPGKGSFLSSYSGSATFPTEFWASDTRGFIGQFSPEELIAAGSYTNDATGIIDVGEKSLAGYVRGDFAFGLLSGNLGLRVVRTWQESVGVSPDLNGIIYRPDAGGITTVPPAADVTVKRAYTDFLPSLNVKFEASDRLQLRFGLSRTMARPNLSDISPTATVNGFFRTVTQLNPYLDPFRANNVDLTAEWYFGRGAVIGASAFYKDIRSLIRNEVTTATYPVQVVRADGSSAITDLIFQVNSIGNGSGVKIKGFELYYQQPFTFLPAPFNGLGAAVNYTFIDNSDPEQLTAASRNNYNITGYYEKGPVGVRLSYSWRGSYLSQASSDTAFGSVVKAFGTLDGSASFKVTENVSLSLEAVNILDTAQRTSFTPGLPSAYVDSGRRLLFGARASF